MAAVGAHDRLVVVVGLSYHFLLRALWNPQGLQWVADVTLPALREVPYAVPAGSLLRHDATFAPGATDNRHLSLLLSNFTPSCAGVDRILSLLFH